MAGCWEKRNKTLIYAIWREAILTVSSSDLIKYNQFGLMPTAKLLNITLCFATFSHYYQTFSGAELDAAAAAANNQIFSPGLIALQVT